MIAAEWSGRVVGVNRRLMTTRRGHIYAFAPYKGFREGLAWCVAAAAGGQRFDGPVAVRIVFTVDWRRDIDSGVKPVLDALQDAGIVRNDLQVVRLVVEKWLHPLGEQDRIRVEVEAVEAAVLAPTAGSARAAGTGGCNRRAATSGSRRGSGAG